MRIRSTVRTCSVRFISNTAKLSSISLSQRYPCEKGNARGTRRKGERGNGEITACCGETKVLNKTVPMYNLTYVDHSPVVPGYHVRLLAVFALFSAFSAAPQLIVARVFCFRYTRNIFLVSVSHGILLGRVSVIRRENIVTLVKKNKMYLRDSP